MGQERKLPSSCGASPALSLQSIEHDPRQEPFPALLADGRSGEQVMGNDLASHGDRRPDGPRMYPTWTWGTRFQVDRIGNSRIRRKSLQGFLASGVFLVDRHKKGRFAGRYVPNRPSPSDTPQPDSGQLKMCYCLGWPGVWYNYGFLSYGTVGGKDV